MAAGTVGVGVIVSGINEAAGPADVSSQGLLLLKSGMLVFPLVCIVAGFIIWRLFFRIDETFYKKIISDLRERGQLQPEMAESPAPSQP